MTTAICPRVWCFGVTEEVRWVCWGGGDKLFLGKEEGRG